MEGDNFAIRHDFYAGTGWNELRVEMFQDPPTDDLGLILGDVMTNARGALDYLVWQLVLREGTEAPGRHNQFPVVTEKAKWAKAARTQLRGVAARWVEKIADLQPFTTDNPSHHLLTALNEMNNYNKHRTIPAGVYFPRPFKVAITTIPGMDYEFDSPDQPFADGAVVFRARSKDRQQLTFGSVDLRLRVGFVDGTGLEWDNAHLLSWIEDAINTFEPAFVN
jgi:hypothetical protein